MNLVNLSKNFGKNGKFVAKATSRIHAMFSNFLHIIPNFDNSSMLSFLARFLDKFAFRKFRLCKTFIAEFSDKY